MTEFPRALDLALPEARLLSELTLWWTRLSGGYNRAYGHSSGSRARDSHNQTLRQDYKRRIGRWSVGSHPRWFDMCLELRHRSIGCNLARCHSEYKVSNIGVWEAAVAYSKWQFDNWDLLIWSGVPGPASTVAQASLKCAIWEA